jgi:DNA-binding MarR family transcriptional regulator
MTVSRGTAHELFLSMLRTQSLLLTSRQHLPRAHTEVDSAAYPVLFELTRGPARLTELAAVVRGDLSTVSRQVTALDRLGLIRKDADPSDGRAHLIALTETGSDLLQRVTDIRADWLQGLLGGWDDDTVEATTSRLGLLGDLLEDWLRGRGATPPAGPADLAPS